jgi:teichuronic acid exporter
LEQAKDTALNRGASKNLSQMMLSGTLWALGERVLRTLVTIGGMAVLARLLTPADYGVQALCLTVVILTRVILEGLIELPVLRHDELTDESLRGLIWVSLALMTGGALTLFFIAPSIERWMTFPRLGEALQAMAPVLIAQVWLAAATGMLQRTHRFKEVASVRLLTVVVYVVLSVALALAGLGLWSILIGQVVSMVTAAGYATWLARSPLGPPSRLALKGLLRTGGVGAVARMLAWGWANADTIALGIFLSPAIVGLYSRAYNLNVHFKEPFSALDVTIRQALAALKHREGGFEVQLLRALRFVTLASSFVAAGAIAGRQELMSILFGSQWVSAAGVMALLAMSLPARIAVVFLDGVATTIGSMSSLLTRHILLVVLIGGGVAYTGRLSPEAVALTVSVSLYASLVLLSARQRGETGLPNRRAVARAMAPGLLLGAALVGASTLMMRPLENASLVVRVLALGAFFGAAFAAVALFLPSAWLPGNIDAKRARLRKRLMRAG